MSVGWAEHSEAEVVEHGLLAAVVVEHEALVELEGLAVVFQASAVVYLLEDYLVGVLVFELAVCDLLHVRRDKLLSGAVLEGYGHLVTLCIGTCEGGGDSHHGK